MKKALSFAVALGLVAGAASVASAAELIMTGDARVRGVYSTNYADCDDTVRDKDQSMDQRYRLKLQVKVNDDVSVHTRVVYGNQDFGYASAPAVTGAALGFMADRAYMEIKTLGGTWTLGRQEVAWANAALPFLGKDETADRIKGIYKAGNLTFGGFLQKNSEGLATAGATATDVNHGNGDSDNWGVVLISKAGDTTVGVLGVYNHNDTAAADAAKTDTGWYVDPYFSSKLGSVTLLGEGLYLSGDSMKRNGKARYGGYVAAVADLAPITVTGLVAYTTNTLSANQRWAPSMLIGTTNFAPINFGNTLSATNPKDRSYLVAGVVNFKASDKVTLGAALGYLGASKYTGLNGGKRNLTEVDVTAEFALAQNAKYKFGVGYGDVDKWTAADDAIWVVGNSVEVAW